MLDSLQTVSLKSKTRDIVGRQFGRLVVTRFSHYAKRAMWECRCVCGKTTLVPADKLLSGHTSSCGCLQRESRDTTTHGKSNTPEYNIWCMMIDRCNATGTSRSKHYGDRGIKVCQRWRNSFTNFLEDMGERPSRHHSIDRKDTNGDYSPDNCKWATQLEQVRNRTNTLSVTYRGKLLPVAELCDLLDLKYSTVGRRLRDGWSVERTFNTPTNER